jgi:predicted CoA-substrate-specific enzyme activase
MTARTGDVNPSGDEPASSNEMRPSAPLIGVDIGSASVKVVAHTKGPESSTGARITAARPLRGRPRHVLADLLERDVLPSLGSQFVRFAVTGYAQGLIADRLDAGAINEVLATAAGVRSMVPEARDVLDIGGQFTKWIRLASSTEELVSDCALNGLCAAGSGAFLEQQSVRLEMGVEELGKLAQSADRGATIAGRCSVFAKSDMIHLQQKGAPPEEIAYGLCLALARTFVATVLADRSVQPILALVGGGAANPGLVRAFRSVLELDDTEAVVAHDHLYAGAVGACLLATEQTQPIESQRALDLLRDGGRLAARDANRAHDKAIDPKVSEGGEIEGSGLEPLRRPDTDKRREATGAAPPSAVCRKDASSIAEDPGSDMLPPEGKIEALLGVDVGSVSTNLVVTTPDDEVLMGVYLPTRGRPVEVLAEGLSRLRQRFGNRLEVVAAGATGSGRHLAERLMGMDVVHNEITAQMVSASRFVPGVDTIFEIGGQDSKYIGARDGHLASFEMNKICAAGTGSFLEEQAERLGVRIVGEFAERAFESETPFALGSRCTVFMDTELVRALQRGASVEDLCAGLAFSIAKNYLEKVVSGRRIGKKIVFSGGTASNEAVVAAFNQVLGRPVHVHPYNRIAGALGAALLAKRFMEDRRSEARADDARRPASRFLGLDAVRDYSIKTFECRQCPNRCQVNRVKVADRVAHFGDACEKYAGRDREERATCETSPHLLDIFDRRSALLAEHLPPPRGERRPKVGLPMASMNVELAPLWATLLDELGFEPVLSRRTVPSMLEQGGRGLPPEVCLPLKLAAGHVEALLRKGVQRVFFPSVMEMPLRSPEDVPHTCLFAQMLPEMVKMSSRGRILAPEVCLSDDEARLAAAREISRCLDRPLSRVRIALSRGLQVQQSFERCRRQLGKSIIESDFERAVVVMGKSYNCHDPYLNLDLARHLRRLGLPAIPFDMLPLDEVALDERWQVLPWRFNRDQLRCLRFVEEDPRLFPLVVTNFGCGPDAFTLKHIEELTSHRPHLVLEFDEHRGEAGLITRLEAFADEIAEHLDSGPTGRRQNRPVVRKDPVVKGRRCFFPRFADHAPIYAAMLRSGGVDARLLDPPDHEIVDIAEEIGSGKECHPYALVTAHMVHLIRSNEAEPGDLFYVPGTVNPCLMCQYGDGARHVLRTLNEHRVKVWDPPVGELEPVVGVPGLVAFYEGLLAIDILTSAACRYRPYEKTRSSVDRAHQENVREIAEAVESLGDVAAAFGRCLKRLWRVEKTEGPRRPVVGVAGDFYTRINPASNANLFARLEEMGCEVWTHTYFSGYEDFCRHRDTMRSWQRVRPGDALWNLLAGGTLSCRAEALTSQLSEELRDHCVEPHPSRLIELASPYLGPWTNSLVLSNVGKMLDFVDRGADGVINAIGLNCMVGISSDCALQAIRRSPGSVPMVTLSYGGSEGPSQKIKLETFVHQVIARAESGGRGVERVASTAGA